MSNTSSPKPRAKKATSASETTTVTTSTDSAPRRNSWSIFGFIALVIVIVLCIVLAVLHPWSTNGDAHTQITDTPRASASPDNQNAQATEDANAQATVVVPSILDNWSYPEQYLTLVKKFGYDTSSYDNNTQTKKDDQKFPTFVVGSLQTDKTIWPDSVRPPLTEKSLEEIVARTLAEPDYCAQNAVGLYNTSIVTPWGETISFKANNPWLKKWFPTDASGINVWAADVMSASPLEQLRTAKKCALVGALLYQFKDNGVQTLTTALNYHIATAAAATVYEGNPFGSIRAFELNPVQYTGEFVVLEFQLKGWPSTCKNQILFNTGDGRFARPVCTIPPSHTDNSVPTPTPPPTNEAKNPALDPENQGHNLPGGGGKAPAQTDNVGSPTGGTPPVTYTAPAAPEVSGPPAGSTPGGNTGGTDQSGGGLN